MAKYFRKGQRVIVAQGRIKVDQYTDKEGNKRSRFSGRGRRSGVRRLQTRPRRPPGRERGGRIHGERRLRGIGRAKTVIFRSEHRAEGGRRYGRQSRKQSARKNGRARRVYDILKNHDQETGRSKRRSKPNARPWKQTWQRSGPEPTPRPFATIRPASSRPQTPTGTWSRSPPLSNGGRPGRKERSKPWKNASARSRTSTKSSWLWTRRRRIVLLTMYYPRRTYEQAAEALGMDVSTVSRQRKTAVERLVRKYIRLHGAIE